ncbi:MAG: putative nitrogen fixation related protein [Chlamydiota bacterium]|jgi:NifU-like protein
MKPKNQARLARLDYVGAFSSDQAFDEGLRLVVGVEGWLSLYWLVDTADGVIADVGYQAFGPPGLLVVAEAISELVLRKNYDQASRVTAALIEREVDHDPIASDYINQALSALDDAVRQCLDIALPSIDEYEQTPITAPELSQAIEGWDQFDLAMKKRLIEEVIDKEIRPYVELDAGGVSVTSVDEQGQVEIAYEGSCVTCHASTGSTLTAIQQILRARLHPSLRVIPKLD